MERIYLFRETCFIITIWTNRKKRTSLPCPPPLTTSGPSLPLSASAAGGNSGAVQPGTPPVKPESPREASSAAAVLNRTDSLISDNFSFYSLDGDRLVKLLIRFARQWWVSDHFYSLDRDNLYSLDGDRLVTISIVKKVTRKCFVGRWLVTTSLHKSVTC